MSEGGEKKTLNLDDPLGLSVECLRRAEHTQAWFRDVQTNARGALGPDQIVLFDVIKEVADTQALILAVLSSFLRQNAKAAAAQKNRVVMPRGAVDPRIVGKQ